MTRASIAGAAVAVCAAVLLVVALVVRDRALDAEPGATTSAAVTPASKVGRRAGFIHGRITTVDGVTHEGRLRWGGDQEAFWSDYFNGAKSENPWAVQARLERPPEERGGVEIFGLRIGGEDRSIKFRRLFMARFGDIARIDARMRDVQVTLKSGTVVALDRFSAGDIAALSKIKGIGKKTAERIVVELKDKVGIAAAWEAASAAHAPTPEEAKITDAVLALIALGYKQVDAHKAVKAAAAKHPGATTEELVTSGLKQLL